MKQCLIAALLLISAAAFSYDLKGVELGAAASDQRLHDALGITCTSGVCEGPLSLAGVSASVSIQRRDEAVVRIVAEFPRTGFEQLSSALTAKFGKPKTAHDVNVTLAFCQGEADTVLTWQDATGADVYLFRYLDRPAKLLMRSSSQAQFETNRARKDAGDI